MAATTGLLRGFAGQDHAQQIRFGSALGVPNSLMSAPPENALPAPVMTIALTAVDRHWPSTGPRVMRDAGRCNPDR
jgi:hypothetical protein